MCWDILPAWRCRAGTSSSVQVSYCVLGRSPSLCQMSVSARAAAERLSSYGLVSIRVVLSRVVFFKDAVVSAWLLKLRFSV